MANENMTLIQTKGTFSIRGIVNGLTTPSKGNGFKADKTKVGVPYQSVRFMVKTSPENNIPVEVFGQVQDNAYFYNSKDKKSIKVKWNQRFMKPKDENIRTIETSFDMAKRINDEFKDGDSVVVVGEIQYSTYTNNQQQTQLQHKFTIKQIYPATTTVDFEAEDFAEKNAFSQQIVIMDTEEVKKENKLYINAYTIAYGEKVNPALFVVDTTTANPKFVESLKKLSLGDFIKVEGLINNRAELIETDDEDGHRVVRNFKKYLEITGKDSATYEKKKYKQDQLTIGMTGSTPPLKDVKFEENTSDEDGRLQFDENDNAEELPFEI